jgi:hypothetical protein
MGTIDNIPEENLEQVYARLVEEHRAWLKSFGRQRVKRWEDLLRADPEAAICEAATRELLSGGGINIEPHEDVSSGGPDFLCMKNNKRFYVEVTCITKEKVTRETNLDDNPKGATYYCLLTETFLGELCNKVPQCSSLDASCMVAIGTLHFQAGPRCFGKHAAEDLLTGTPRISMEFDHEQARGIGDIYQSTDLRDSAFIRFDKTLTGQIECARNPISAVLLCSFGCSPTKVVGVLHPNPNYRFDRSLLPDIEFCRLAEGYQTGKFVKEWV